MLCTLFMAMAAQATTNTKPLAASVKLVNSTVTATDAIFVNFTLVDDVLAGAIIRVTLPVGVTADADALPVATIKAATTATHTDLEEILGSPNLTVETDAQVITITTAALNTYDINASEDVHKFVSIKLTNIKNPATAVTQTEKFELSIAPVSITGATAIASKSDIAISRTEIEGVAIKNAAFSYGLAMICALLVASQ